MTSGFLLLDKGVGASSFQALYPVKRLFRGQKVGHAGTLDPAASGLLLVAVGHATRLLEFIEGMPKVYRFDLQLGLITDTYDLEGEVLERHEVPAIDDAALEGVLKDFRGILQQTPPAYSAVKIQGKRACDRVRAGETVELASRQVTIHDLKVISRHENTITLELFCSKGTYVRTLAHDIGKRLGCGGVATAIRRLRIGPFDVSQAKTENALTGEADLLPTSSAMNHLPGVHLTDRWVSALLNGNSIPPVGYATLVNEQAPANTDSAADTDSSVETHSSIETLYRVHDKTGRLLAIAEINALRQLLPRKVLNPS